jgi:hypothetical protein
MARDILEGAYGAPCLDALERLTENRTWPEIRGFYSSWVIKPSDKSTNSQASPQTSESESPSMGRVSAQESVFVTSIPTLV